MCETGRVFCEANVSDRCTTPVELVVVVGSLSSWVGVRLAPRRRRSTRLWSRGGALPVLVVAPTSPGWGPVFGGRPAAAVLAAAVDLVVPFFSLSCSAMACGGLDTKGA